MRKPLSIEDAAARILPVRLPRFGVVGAKAGADGLALQRCWNLGAVIARAGCDLLTRTTTGLAHAAVLGASSAGGRIVGISPAASFEEHVNGCHAPWREYNLLIFTGEGAAAHELVHVRSCDILIITGERTTTLDELVLACTERKLIGILGIAQRESDLTNGAEIICDDDPERLVARLLWAHVSRSSRSECGDARAAAEAHA